MVSKAQQSVMNEPYSSVQMINGIQMIVNSYVQKNSGIPMSRYSYVQMTTNESLPIKVYSQLINLPSVLQHVCRSTEYNSPTASKVPLFRPKQT